MGSNTPLLHIGISAAGTVVGTLVACATYATFRTTANGSAFVVGQGSRLLGYLLGRGAEYVAGSRIGDVVQAATAAAGTEVLAPALRTGGEATAAATAAVAGAGAALLTTGVLYGGMYVGRKVYEHLPAMEQRNFLQHPEPMRFDLKDAEEGFDMVVVTGTHVSQLHTEENRGAAVPAAPAVAHETATPTAGAAAAVATAADEMAATADSRCLQATLASPVSIPLECPISGAVGSAAHSPHMFSNETGQLPFSIPL